MSTEAEHQADVKLSVKKESRRRGQFRGGGANDINFKNFFNGIVQTLFHHSLLSFLSRPIKANIPASDSLTVYYLKIFI